MISGGEVCPCSRRGAVGGAELLPRLLNLAVVDIIDLVKPRGQLSLCIRRLILNSKLLEIRKHSTKQIDQYLEIPVGTVSEQS